MLRKYGWLLAVSLTILLFDQWTKFMVLDRLTAAFSNSPSALHTFLTDSAEPSQTFASGPKND